MLNKSYIIEFSKQKISFVSQLKCKEIAGVSRLFFYIFIQSLYEIWPENWLRRPAVPEVVSGSRPMFDSKGSDHFSARCWSSGDNVTTRQRPAERLCRFSAAAFVF